MCKILLNKGYTQASNLNTADIILINTCAVREKAEEKALSIVGRLADLKKRSRILLQVSLDVWLRKGGQIFLNDFLFLTLF